MGLRFAFPSSSIPDGNCAPTKEDHLDQLAGMMNKDANKLHEESMLPYRDFSACLTGVILRRKSPDLIPYFRRPSVFRILPLQPAPEPPPSRPDEPSVGSEVLLSVRVPRSVALLKPLIGPAAENLAFVSLAAGGVLARSTDAPNWLPQGRDTSNDDLLAGATVGWVGGGGRTVPSTIEGGRWQEVVSSTNVDRLTVAAGDKSFATISTNDERPFTTHHGNLAWQLSGSKPDRIAGTM
jgi:hypothetical protein